MRGLIPGPMPGKGGGSRPRTEIILGRTGTPAVGSTNNRIPLFNVDVHNNGGADFTRTNSATLGSYFTIVTPGLYFVQGAIVVGTLNAGNAVRKGTINNTLNLDEADVGVYPLGIATGGNYPNISGYVQCAAADNLHLVSNVAISATYPGLWKFGLIGPF
jgi:hypothetical protein